MDNLEKHMIKVLNDLRLKRQEYFELSQQEGPNKEYFTGKHDAYVYAVDQMENAILFVKPELLKP